MQFYNDRLAYEHTPGNNGSVLFCGGFASNMYGTKATALAHFCQENDLAYTRFDYSGHGNSKGEFLECNISIWLQDSIDILCNITNGPQIIIGSSMGGWLMLLLALRYPERINGLIGIAAAPDFTEDLYSILSHEQKLQLQNDNYTFMQSAADGNTYLVTKGFLEDGKKNLLFSKPSIKINAPVILLHGMKDHVVPYQQSLKISEKLTSEDVTIRLLKHADHSMNDDKALETLYSSIVSIIHK